MDFLQNTVGISVKEFIPICKFYPDRGLMLCFENPSVNDERRYHIKKIFCEYLYEQILEIL